MRWYTADLHFGHANIIRYCDRPFTTVDEMDEGLIARWNETVGPDDEVWVVGDVAMGQLHQTLSRVSALHGRKMLVPGNHDRCWPGHRKDVERWSAEYQAAGFERILPSPRQLDIGGTAVTIDHFPYRGDSGNIERYTDQRPPDHGGWLVHGHIHDRWRQSDRQINVGVDAWGGRPVAGDQLAELINAGPAELAPLPW
jgi:calcineurin-like phosphoesterase family protein